MKRKIAVVTGSRAEYGHLYWIIKGIKEDKDLKLQLIVTGMHLSTEFGLTVKEIKRDGFGIAEEVDILLSSDTEEATAISMGLGVIGFAKAYSRLKPDIILVLGDRFEIFSAVGAAVPFKIPVAHIHGGETTRGAFDEQFRHSITKMSHIHFAATKEYRRRIIQMGEDPSKVFCFGAPGLDNIKRLHLFDRKTLWNELRLPEDKRIGVVTFHPVTLEFDTAERQTTQLLAALKSFKEIFWVFTSTNADPQGRKVEKKIESFVKGNSFQAKLFISLGQLKYLSLLKYSDVMVGNSSSGIIEAPSFRLPTVNIGDRQNGRIRTVNVIDVKEYKKELIFKAIKKAISMEFRKSLRQLKNPYGTGEASEKILAILKNITLNSNLIKKEFYEFGNIN